MFVINTYRVYTYFIDKQIEDNVLFNHTHTDTAPGVGVGGGVGGGGVQTTELRLRTESILEN